MIPPSAALAALEADDIADLQDVASSRITISLTQPASPRQSAERSDQTAKQCTEKSDIKKKKKAQKPPKAWDKDMPTGELCSLDYLIDFLAEIEGNTTNYSRYRGGGAGGVTRDVVCTEAVTYLISKGITWRNKQDVRAKIQQLQSSFQRAEDYLANTGAGLLEEDYEQHIDSVKAFVYKLCPYYDQLKPIMGARAASCPLYLEENGVLLQRDDMQPKQARQDLTSKTAQVKTELNSTEPISITTKRRRTTSSGMDVIAEGTLHLLVMLLTHT